MRFAFPISKTEELEDGRLLIEGVATSEALDCQGDILDYEGSKKAFEKWRGNLREAHDPKKPVGKALEVIPDDESKSIAVRAFISKGAPDTQAKILDGTLAMFSVGGGAPTKTKLEKSGGKTARRVLEWPMTELSLVDVGANPDAAVSVLKVADGEEEAEPAPPESNESEEAEQTPKEKSEEPVQLSEAQMTELVTKVTDAVLAAIEAKQKKDEAPEPPKPEDETGKAAPADGIRKDEEADVLCAASILDQLKNLRVAEGTEPEIETKQLAALSRAASALAEFIALEAGEVIANAEAPAPEAMIELAAKIDGLVKAVGELAPAIQKSAPQPDPRIDALSAGIEAISKAMGEVKADTGDLKALRESMAQILKMPVPGRAPLRAFTPEMVQKTASPETNETDVLRKAAAGAPPAVRAYLLNEVAAIERG